MFIYSAAYCTNKEIGKLGEAKIVFDETSGALPKWGTVFSSTHERYPRFDPLSKAVALLAESLLGKPPVQNNIGLILATAEGSFDADLEFYKSAIHSPELASPKLFPYTLPSAGLAEVMIRYGITGPSLVMWQSEGLDAMAQQIKRWLQNQEIDAGVILMCDTVFSGLAAPGVQGFALLLGPEARGPRLAERNQQTMQEVWLALQAGNIEILSQ